MPHPVDQHVGKRLKHRRTLMGMSQAELAEAVGITFQQVQKYERATNRMGASRLFEFAQVLQVPVAYFFEGLDKQQDVLLRTTQNGGMAEESEEFEYEEILSGQGGREATELMRSFNRLQNPTLRKSIMSFIRSVADGKPMLDE